MGPRHEEGAQSPRNDQPRWQRQSGLFQAQEGDLSCLHLLPVQPAVVRCCILLTPHASGLQVVLVEDRKWGPEERDLLYQVDFTWQNFSVSRPSQAHANLRKLCYSTFLP